VQSFGGVDLPGLFDRRLETPRPTRDADREHRAPAGRSRRRREGASDRGETARELAGVDVRQPLEHDRAAALTLLDDLRPHLRQGRSRDVRTIGDLVDEVQGDVELAHGSERFGEPPDLAPRLAGLGVLQPFGEDRQSFPQPPRCDARLVNADVLARYRGCELTLERSVATVKEAHQRQ
jgi:hypothetical protein